jgi:hypothetical protein
MIKINDCRKNLNNNVALKDIPITKYISFYIEAYAFTLTKTVTDRVNLKAKTSECILLDIRL